MSDPERQYPTLTTDILSENLDLRAENVRDGFDLTGLYVWHKTEEQANAVLAAIEPNAIVLTEGYMRDPAYAAIRLAQHLALARGRLVSGAYTPELSDDCDALTLELRERRYSPPAETDPYSYRLYQGLLEKGCVILPADYLNLSDGAQGIHDAISEMAELNRLLEDPNLDISSAIDRNIEFINTSLADQQLRESMAALYTLYFLDYYSKFDLASITKASNGKARAYILYGIAHRNSLTSKFREYGLEIHTEFVHLESTPIADLPDLSVQFAQTPSERRRAVVDHYMGMFQGEPKSYATIH